MKLCKWICILAAALACAPAAWAQEATGNLMEVSKSAICSRIVKRQPVQRGVRFSPTVGKVYCFSQISNIEFDTLIQHVWYYHNTERARVELTVKPPTWRTYSSKRIMTTDTGRWRVDILDYDGNVLKTLGFDIIP